MSQWGRLGGNPPRARLTLPLAAELQPIRYGVREYRYIKSFI